MTEGQPAVPSSWPDPAVAAVFEALPEGVAVLDAASQLRYASPRFTTLLPTLLSQLSSRSVPSDLATTIARVMGGTAHSSLLFEQPISGMVPRTCELAIRPLEVGSERWVLLSARDVSDRIARERAQRESESLLGAILETCGVGLCLWDHRNRFVSCNRSFCELLGFRPEELVGRPIAKVLATEEVDRAQALFAELLSAHGKSAASQSLELRCRRKDGSLLDVVISASVLLRDEGRRFVVGSVMDISERKEKQLELVERAMELQREAESKSELNAALTEKLALIERQHQQILDLSAPILDVFEGVLLLPLIGTLDDVRARTITERLLEAVVSHRAKLVLLDLTGVDALDRDSSKALGRMLSAIEMLGSRPILTGISPQVAMTLTRGDADLGRLSQVATLSDLKAGVRYCLTRR